MKVLQIGSSLNDWGGIERYIVYLTKGLSARGHQVRIACPPRSPLAKRAENPLLPAKLRFQFGWWQLPTFVRLFRKFRPDVVHVHFSPDFVIPVRAAHLAKIPRIVMTRHVALPWTPQKVRRYAGSVDRIIGVSEAVRAILLDSGVPAEKLVVAKAGCPPLHPVKEAAPPGDRFSVGYFGRLVPDKGVQYLVEAAASLPEAVDVSIYGEGPMRSELAARGTRCRFHGFVADVADAMAAMDAIVIPSVWAEAFPFAVLEAMSLGKPVIATQRGGLPEMVAHGETGLLIEAEDAAALAAAIQSLAQDRARAAAMGRLGQEIHRKEFTIEAFAARIERVYEEMPPAR